MAVPIRGERVSSVFDAAKDFELFSVDRGQGVVRSRFSIDEADLIEKTRRLIEMRIDVLICGALSKPAEMCLNSAGVQVFCNTCGLAQEVVETFFSGRLTHQAFLMPGCNGNRRRGRQRRRRGRKW